MPRYRVSYTFTDEFTGDAEAIKRAIRDLTFAESFTPEQFNSWRVFPQDGGGYVLRASRTITREHREGCEREAVRLFLYNLELPPKIDFAKVRVEALEPVLAEVAA